MTTEQQQEIRWVRLMGEMAGALEVVRIVANTKQINIKGIEDILRRYREEFEEKK